MNENNTMHENTALDTTPDIERDDAPLPDDCVTVTLTVTPDACSIAAERIRQSLSCARVEKTTTLFSAMVIDELHQYRRTCPTPAAAWQACRDLGRLAGIRFGAAIMLDEEEFKVVAGDAYHSVV